MLCLGDYLGLFREGYLWETYKERMKHDNMDQIRTRDKIRTFGVS
jgi:hypothetical protein